MMKTMFKKDLENRKMFVTREFDGNLKRVWQAWTEPKILDQWWAPKPWKAQTKSMDFRDGGSWLYVMTGPDGTQSWSKAEFVTVIELKSYEGIDSFCDEKGVINHEMPVMNWKVSFFEAGHQTRVEVEMTFESGADLEKITEMGFKEGFSAAHDNLDELLKK